MMKCCSCGQNQFLDRVYLHSKAELELNKNQSFRYHYFLNENTAFSFDFRQLELCDVSGSDTLKHCVIRGPFFIPVSNFVGNSLTH